MSEQLRLKSRTETPNGGWRFFQNETVWKAPFTLSDTFDVAVRKIIYHRKGNARFNLSIDYETVALELEGQTARSLIDRGMGAQYVVGAEKKTPLPMNPTLHPVREAVAGLVESIRKDTVGAASLAEWIGEGSHPVSQEQADTRTSICRECPQNQSRRGRLKEVVASAIKSYTEVKTKLGLRTHNEAELKTCAICDCPLKLKVWVPLKYILSHTPVGKFPDNCWIQKESKIPPPKAPLPPPAPQKATITIQRWGAFGDVITATALASRVKAHGFNVRFSTHKAMMPALAGHPDITEVVEHGSVTPDINLDGAYEQHPERKTRPLLALFEEAARKQVRNPVAVLGTNGHFKPVLTVTEAEREPFLKLFSAFQKPWIVVVPKSGKWANRSVPDDIWIKTASLVKGTCFWTGYDRIGAPIIDLGTRDFRRVMAAVDCADLVVTVDTGPMHVAAALNKPILAIQQAMDLSLRLSNETDWTSFAPDLTCLKCGEFVCPINKDDPPCTHLNATRLAEAINRRTHSSTPIRQTNQPSQIKTIFDSHTKGHVHRAVMTSDYVTVVLTVHKRHEHVDAALKSILAAGFTKVVITASGVGSELERWLSMQDANGHKIVWNTEGTNNDQWLAGVDAVTTPFTIIFHDDDLMAPGYADKLLPLVMGEADFSVCNTGGHGPKCGDVQKDFLMKTGIRNSRVVHDELLRQKLSISTVRGCFPTGKLLDALKEWKNSHDGDKRFEPWNEFVVGNDLLIWLKAVTILERCLVIADQCVSYNHHDGSATQVNADSKSGKFESIYQLVKDQHANARFPNYCGLCYIHDWKNSSGIVRSVARNDPGADIVWFTDSDEPSPVKAQKIPKIGSSLQGLINSRYIAANVAFVYGLRLVRKLGMDWFMWLEYDCRFRGNRWMVQLWQENLSWQWDHVCAGSPVVWNLPGFGTRTAAGLLPYFGKYTSETGFFPAFEGWGGGLSAFYPNGALSWYHTETMCDWFSIPLAMDHAGIQKWCSENTTFDLYVGQQMIKRYGSTAAMKMGWLESAYSGCGEHYYNSEQRRNMLDGKRIIAVHQEKDNSK